MMSPSASVKTLVGLSQNNTALVLPNTVFSSKPISNQDVGVFLQSSGKNSNVDVPAAAPVTVANSSNNFYTSKPVLLASASALPQFALPKSSGGPVIKPVTLGTMSN